MSSVQPLLDAAGRRRSLATRPGFRAGKAPRKQGSCRRRHEPLLRGGRPRWYPGRVAGDRRRPAQSMSGADSMTSSFGRWLTTPSSRGAR